MANTQLEFIQKQLDESVNWNTKNTESMGFHRLEGTLKAGGFNRDLLASLKPHEPCLKELTHEYACGFEIEFYLSPDKIPQLELDIAARLPDYQMLLVDLTSVPKTNHRNFYLIHENTGTPPKGMASYELVSPILDYKSLPYFIETLFALLLKHNAKDDDNIGFHLHASTPNSAKISPIALLYFLHKNGVLEAKERQFTRDIIQQFFAYSPEDWKFIYEEITRKCYNVNLLHFSKHNHIELRSMGGLGYLKNTQGILKNCFTCLKAYQQTLDTPSKEVSENILKTYALDHKLLKTQQLSYQELKNSQTDDTWFV